MGWGTSSKTRRSASRDIGSASWFVAVVIGAPLLGIGIAYGLWQWSNRPRDPQTERTREKAIEDLYDRPSQD